jgi:uncharacterized repeat protein (TIGR01451 family)
MHTAPRRCPSHRFFGILLLLATLILPTAARAAHENITIDGDLTDLITAINNNLGPSNGGFTASDPLGDTYTGPCAYVNGYDLRQSYILVDYKDEMGDEDPSNVILYAGWDVEGIVGDVDGDGNPDTYDIAGPGGSTGCALSDEAGIGPNESYNVLLDLDCTGGVDDVRIQIKNGVVSRVVNNVITPLAGATFAFSGGFLELKVPNYQTLLSGLQVTTDLCDARFRLTANAEFDGPGEDFSSAFQLELLPSVDVTKTPSEQAICAGEPVTWTITVTNDGLCRLDDITVTDILGAGLTYSTSDNTPDSIVGQTVTWSFPGIGLGPGDTKVITLTASTPAECADGTLTNDVTVDAIHLNPCLAPGTPAPTASDKASASVTCRELPACDITGDQNTCVGRSETYSTSIGAPYTRLWSVTSTPPGICNSASDPTGSSITVNFTGAGVCTVSLTITDPLNPEVCTKTCTYLVTVNPPPPCNIAGDDHTCFPSSSVYTTTVGAEYTRAWSVSSVPPGIAAINGAANGGSVTVDFTGAGTVTVTLLVTDPNDPTDCFHECTFPVEVEALPPCNISGDLSTCIRVPGPTQETYTTTVGAEYNRLWSVESVPPGIATFVGGVNTGGSVTLAFSGTGDVTLTLTVSDPNDPEVCAHECDVDIEVLPTPPCNIDGDQNTCYPTSEVYTTTVGDEYLREWSVMSNPPGIASINGSTTGGSVTVDFTGAGTVTVKLGVFDPDDRTDCLSMCELEVEVGAEPPCSITACAGQDLVTESCIGDTLCFFTPNFPAYDVTWSLSGNPPGACVIVGADDHGVVQVALVGAGTCTLTLTVVDPSDPEECPATCELEITANPLPPCNITGATEASIGDTVTVSTSVNPAEFMLMWMVEDEPDGTCEILGSTTGSSVDILMTGSGTCTVTLRVKDLNNPDECYTECSHVIEVAPEGFACPHTIGFWRQQCAQRGNGSTKVCRTGMENLWRCVITETDVVQWRKNDGSFQSTASLAALSNASLFDALCSQLNGPRPMTIRDMAEIQYLGLMLNVCSGALPLDIQISGFGTVQQAIDYIENALNTGNNISSAAGLADDINNRVGVLAEDCPEGDDLFRNLPGCTVNAAGNLDFGDFNDPNVLSTRPFPNPVTANAVSIQYNIPTTAGSADVRITIFDVSGRVVKSLVPGVQDAGSHSADWDLRDDDGASVPSGIYFYRLVAGEETITEKLMVVRK